MTVQDFDFRNPPARKQSTLFASWLGELVKLVNQRWMKRLPFPVTISLPKTETVAHAEIRGRLPANGVAFRIHIADEHHAILVMPRPLLACFIGGTFGETYDSVPDDRGLTPVEDSITGVIIEDFFLTSLRQVVPGDCTLQQRGTIRAVSKEPDSDLVLVATFALTPPFETLPIWLLWPEKSLKPVDPNAGFAPEIRAQMESLVKEMPAEFAVVLGNAQVTLGDLATMRAGDLLILNQKIHQPLPAKIMGAEKFTVWPGAVGSRQAVQIETVLDRS
jgi:flagellar motor switch protein FliM